MKIFVSLLALIFFEGCTTTGRQDGPFTLIWRESSGIPIEEVETPAGFQVSPFDAIRHITKRRSRPPWAEDYLFIALTYYYFGSTRKGTELSEPEKGHWIIDGMTGEISYLE